MLKANSIVYDKENRSVFMVESEWGLNMTKQNYPEIKFYSTSDCKMEEHMHVWKR